MLIEVLVDINGTARTYTERTLVNVLTIENVRENTDGNAVINTSNHCIPTQEKYARIRERIEDMLGHYK